MHTVSKDGNGAPTVTSKQLDPKPVKLKEAQGEATDSKPTKTEKPKDEVSELDHKILQALDSLGGKDIDNVTIAKKVGTTRTHPRTPQEHPSETRCKHSKSLATSRPRRKAQSISFR
jgi:hypothetical protein